MSEKHTTVQALPPRATRRTRAASAHPASARPGDDARRKAVLLFFYTPTSGPSRRMESLVSWMYVRERKRLRLRMIDAGVRRDLAARYGVSIVPTLVLLQDDRVVARIEGRATGSQIEERVLPHLA